jgi:EmrB/QacA subfamily drug resistance transporter
MNMRLKIAGENGTIIALLLGGFITIFDMFVVNLALPSIRVNFHATWEEVGFVISAYQVAFGALLIAGSRLGDIHGRQKIYLIGTLIFLVGSIFCGIAGSIWQLIGSRIVQGIGAALLQPQIYATIRTCFDENRRRRIFGYLGMALGISAISGQAVGGICVGINVLGLGWRSIFLVNVPIGILIISLIRGLRNSKANQTTAVDWIGTLLLAACLATLLVPLMEGANNGWPDWTQQVLSLAFLFGALFVCVEITLMRSGGHPVVDFLVLSNYRFAGGVAVVFLVYFTSSSFFMCMASLLQSGLGLSALSSGLIFIPGNAAFAITSLTAPKILKKFGSGFLSFGIFLYSLSFVFVIFIVSSVTAANLPEYLLGALILLGVGQALSMTPIINVTLDFVSASQSGVASGLIATTQQIGAAFGVAIVGSRFATALKIEPHGHGPLEAYSGAFSHALTYNIGASILAVLIIARISSGRKLK